MFNPVSIQIPGITGPLKIHLFSTGGVAVKNRFRTARFAGLAAMADFIVDRHFTEWLPIWVMVVEHPEGVFVIDAGEVADVMQPGYFKQSGFIESWFDTSQFKFTVSRDEELDRQLAALNIPPEKIKAIILTHLHFDHTDGIKHFPCTPILVSKAEWQKPYGSLPKLYPAWFKPRLVELNERFYDFKKASYITQAKDIILVETPGHTYHHCSVLVKTTGPFIMFAADVCYNQQQLLQASFPGNNASNKLALQTYSAVKNFAKNNPVVFIPSHDAGAEKRLRLLETLAV